MTTTRSQPLRRDHITSLIDHARRVAPDIDQGWTCANAEVRDAGWPTRSDAPTPVCTKGERNTPCGKTKCRVCGQPPRELKYADPTGEMATGHLERVHEDLMTMQDHREVIESSIKALVTLARKYMPDEPTHDSEGSIHVEVPQCAERHCRDEVEYKRVDGEKRYYGMEKTSRGEWVAKVGSTPRCAKHRRRANSDAA